MGHFLSHGVGLVLWLEYGVVLVQAAGVWQSSGLVQAGSGSSSSRVSVLGWNSCHLKTCHSETLFWELLAKVWVF